MAAFILLVILTACFAILLHQRSRGAEAVDPELAEAGEPTALLATDGMRELPKDYRQQALTLIASYGRARDVAEVLPLLRSGGGLPASLVRSWQPWQAEDDWNPVIDPKIEHRQLNGHQYLLVKGRKPCSAPFRSYLVVENEGLRIDWEATEAFSESEFARLEAGEGGGITRALLGRGRFFTSVFPETGFDCYRLLSPDGSRILWGYAKRGGSAQQQLAELPDGGERMRPVTLRLSRHSAGGLENQWLIEEMLHIEWSAPYAAGHAFD